MVTLLGGHVELAMANPGEALAQMEAKKVRVLGATTSQRLSLAPDVPTLKEQGINVVFQQFRSIAAPKDISAEAVKYYEGVFKKLSESTLWREKYIRENMLTPDYTTSAETYKLWEGQSNMYAKIMKEMGIIKQAGLKTSAGKTKGGDPVLHGMAPFSFKNMIFHKKNLV